MEVLDADEEALYSETFRQYMAADIVQFVPFNEFKHNRKASINSLNKDYICNYSKM